MNRLFSLFLLLFVFGLGTSCASDEPQRMDERENATAEDALFGGKKVLIAYFSWGGTTKRMAEQIQGITDGDLFEIEPVNPYPTSYTPCTEVALEERDNDARPGIKDIVENWEDYDVVFLGGPVWWHTAPMILHTFAESYNFDGKTVVPFCTYASTHRDETLTAIADMTPKASHLSGEGLTSGQINEDNLRTWIEVINGEWNNLNPSSEGSSGMSGLSGIMDAMARSENGNTETSVYNLKGQRVNPATISGGIYIVKDTKGTKKVML